MRKLEVIDMHRMSVDEFRASDKMPLTVVLDNVRSMHNVGSVLRTSDAFRVERVVMCGITSTPPHPELHKTALGAEDSVDWEYVKDTMDVVHRLHDDDYTIYAIEQCEGSLMLNDLDFDNNSSKFKVKVQSQKTAIILGNEVHGVRQDVVDACDGVIEIPQFGTKHSLNVSVTAGIVIWEMARRLLLTCAFLLISMYASAQVESDLELIPIEMDSICDITPVWYMKRKPEFYDGEWIRVIVLPEIPVYKEKVFRNKKERQRYDRLVYNVKKVLPLAKMANKIIVETYETLETLPPAERDKHMKAVEREIKKQYTPIMKKLTYSQGKLLIKLIDRECNQSSYKIVKAFLGSGRAFFYQMFAWTFGASLKKTYHPEGEDREVEEVVRLVEIGAL